MSRTSAKQVSVGTTTTAGMVSVASSRRPVGVGPTSPGPIGPHGATIVTSWAGAHLVAGQTQRSRHVRADEAGGAGHQRLHRPVSQAK